VTGNVPTDLKKLKDAGATPSQIAEYMAEYGKDYTVEADTPGASQAEIEVAKIIKEAGIDRSKPYVEFQTNDPKLGVVRIQADLYEKSAPQQRLDLLKKVGQVPMEAVLSKDGQGYVIPKETKYGGIPEDLYQTYERNRDLYPTFGKYAPQHYEERTAGFVTVVPYKSPSDAVTYAEPAGLHIIFKNVSGTPIISRIINKSDNKTAVKANADGAFDDDAIYTAVKTGKISAGNMDAFIGDGTTARIMGYTDSRMKALDNLRGYTNNGIDYDLALAIREGRIEDVRRAKFRPEDIVNAQLQATTVSVRTTGEQQQRPSPKPVVASVSLTPVLNDEQQRLKSIYDAETGRTFWGRFFRGYSVVYNSKTNTYYPLKKIGGSPLVGAAIPGVNVAIIVAALSGAGLAVANTDWDAIAREIESFRNTFGRAPTIDDVTVSVDDAPIRLADIVTPAQISQSVEAMNLAESPLPSTYVRPLERNPLPTVYTRPLEKSPVPTTFVRPLEKSPVPTIFAHPLSKRPMPSLLEHPVNELQIPSILLATATASQALASAPAVRRVLSPTDLARLWGIGGTGAGTSVGSASYITGTSIQELDQAMYNALTLGQLSQAEMREYKAARERYLKAKGLVEEVVQSSDSLKIARTRVPVELLAAGLVAGVAVAQQTEGMTQAKVDQAVKKAIETVTGIQPMTVTSKMVDAAVQIAAQIAAQTATQAATQTGTQIATNTATRTTTQTATKTATKTATRTATQTAVQSMTDAAAKEATREAVREAEQVREAEMVRTPPPPPIELPMLGGGSGSASPTVPNGSLVWKRGIFWKALAPPYKQSKPVTLRNMPRGAYNGDTAQDTLQIIGNSRTAIPNRIYIDEGIVDYFITGNGKSVEFSGKGENTNVGTRLSSFTRGMSIDDDGGDYLDDVDIHGSSGKVSKPRTSRKHQNHKSRQLTEYERMTTLKGFRA
jgi:hypothetical protein